MSSDAGTHAGEGPQREPASWRRPAVDVGRVLALWIVVLGHLTMAVVDHHGGEVRGDNLFELKPSWAWLAALAPMPVFFAAGGWANATGTLRSAAARLATLVGTAAAAVALWSLAVVAATVVSGDAGLIGRGARLATQPLWFLAAYVPLAAAGALVARLTRRRAVVCIGGALAVLAMLDGLRFGAGAPAAIGWAGFPLAWATPWMLGAWWRDRAREQGFRERRVGMALLIGGVAAGWGLVAFAGYSAALIDVSDSGRSNTTPPGLYTAVISAAQVGAFMVGARLLDRIGERWRSLWDRAGAVAIGLYVWHLTALSLSVGLLAIGFPTPDRLTPTWWATRPLWWASVLVVTGALVLATGVVRNRTARAVPTPASRVRLAAGAAAATAGGAVTGLEGPRSIGFALLCTVTLGGGWWLMRGPRGPRARPSVGSERRTPSAGTSGPVAGNGGPAA